MKDEKAVPNSSDVDFEKPINSVWWGKFLYQEGKENGADGIDFINPLTMDVTKSFSLAELETQTVFPRGFLKFWLFEDGTKKYIEIHFGDDSDDYGDDFMEDDEE